MSIAPPTPAPMAGTPALSGLARRIVSDRLLTDEQMRAEQGKSQQAASLWLHCLPVC